MARIISSDGTQISTKQSPSKTNTGSSLALARIRHVAMYLRVSQRNMAKATDVKNRHRDAEMEEKQSDNEIRFFAENITLDSCLPRHALEVTNSRSCGWGEESGLSGLLGHSEHETWREVHEDLAATNGNDGLAKLAILSRPLQAVHTSGPSHGNDEEPMQMVRSCAAARAGYLETTRSREHTHMNHTTHFQNLSYRTITISLPIPCLQYLSKSATTRHKKTSKASLVPPTSRSNYE